MLRAVKIWTITKWSFGLLKIGNHWFKPLTRSRFPGPDFYFFLKWRIKITAIIDDFHSVIQLFKPFFKITLGKITVVRSFCLFFYLWNIIILYRIFIFLFHLHRACLLIMNFLLPLTKFHVMAVTLKFVFCFCFFSFSTKYFPEGNTSTKLMSTASKSVLTFYSIFLRSVVKKK